MHDAGGEFFLTEVRARYLYPFVHRHLTLPKHHRLLALLLDIAKEELGADIRFDCHVVQLSADCRSVVLQSGETLQADIVVGADSVSGPCRSLVTADTAQNPIDGTFMTYSYAQRTTMICTPAYVTYSSVIPADKMKADPELIKLVINSGEGFPNWVWFGDGCAAMTFPIVRPCSPHVPGLPDW